MLNLFFLVLGLVLLTLGGEALIRGALGAARRFGVSPLLSGLFIVGFGTSAPELVVSIEAALASQPDIALGNVVGSNIANILLILGICALIAPLAVRPLALRRDAVTVVAASILFLVLAGGGLLALADGLVLLVCLGAYLGWAYWSETYQAEPAADVHRAEAEELTAVPKPLIVTVLAILTGLLLLVGGSHVLIKGAVGLAGSLGVSQAMIGLTVVAVGTSLPELAVSVVAALRRHADVAVGNILGSNIFNLLGIMGVSALLQPLPVHARILQYDQWVMLGAAMLLLFFLYTGQRLSRLEGATLLALYGCYIGLGLAVFGA